MSIKKSTYFNDTSERVLTLRDKRMKDPVMTPNFSRLVNTTIARYHAMCQASLPDLDTSEWGIILNTYMGCSDVGSHYSPVRIASDIMDDLGELSVDDIATKDPEMAAFLRKVHGFNQSEQIAIMDVVQQYQNNHWPENEFPDLNSIIAEITKERLL